MQRRGRSSRRWTPATPASRAGLAPGDVIVRAGEMKIGSVEDLFSALRAHKPGDRLSVTLLRAGRQRTVAVTLAELPSAAG